jgi:hypothetical protein
MDAALERTDFVHPLKSQSYTPVTSSYTQKSRRPIDDPAREA